MNIHTRYSFPSVYMYFCSCKEGERDKKHFQLKHSGHRVRDSCPFFSSIPLRLRLRLLFGWILFCANFSNVILNLVYKYMPGTFQANDILFVDFYRLSLCERATTPPYPLCVYMCVLVWAFWKGGKNGFETKK